MYQVAGILCRIVNNPIHHMLKSFDKKKPGIFLP